MLEEILANNEDSYQFLKKSINNARNGAANNATNVWGTSGM